MNTAKLSMVRFDTTDKSKWLCKISEVVNADDFIAGQQVILVFDDKINEDQISSIHLVSLACLIEYLNQRNIVVALQDSNKNVSEYLTQTLHIQDYWKGKQNYVPAKDDSIFNLWRVKDSEKEVHSQLIHDYLKRTFFKHKDLSVVQSSLDEAYYNIFDHAEAGENAFSSVRYNKENEKLYVAICDFGIGIAQSVRTAMPEIEDDAKALAQAMEYKFTTGSRSHNMGMGLGNIKDACTEDDFLGIISNQGCLFAKRENIRTYKNLFCFPGTLIYYELSLSRFEDEEFIESFTL